MEFKGTKGEWKLGNHFSNIVTNEKPNRPSYSEKDFESEKEYYGGYLVTESVSRKADALLIAAAPELLNSCNELLELLKFHGYEHSTEIYEAKKAINKALGQ